MLVNGGVDVGIAVAHRCHTHTDLSLVLISSLFSSPVSCKSGDGVALICGREGERERGQQLECIDRRRLQASAVPHTQSLTLILAFAGRVRLFTPPFCAATKLGPNP